jgi:transmembrane sensor
VTRRWSEDLRDAFEEDALARTWTRIAGHPARQTRRARWIGLAAAAALAAAMVALWYGPPREPAAATTARIGPLARRDGGALGRMTQGERVALDDDSRIDVDEVGEIETLANDAERVVLHLVRGGARFRVTPGGPRRWQIEAGGVTVEVVGTELTVVRDADVVRVAVDHGVVLVRGAEVPDGVQRVSAGESITVGPAQRVDPPPPSVALRPARTSPAPEPVVPRLFEDADRARLEGRDEDALAIFDRIVREHPDAPEAPFAALSRARLLLRLGRTSEARARLDALLSSPLPASLEQTVRAVRASIPDATP